MNKDLEKFLKSFEDFAKHSQEHQENEKTKEYAESVLEKHAAELEITVDYYIAEFL